MTPMMGALSIGRELSAEEWQRALSRATPDHSMDGRLTTHRAGHLGIAAGDDSLAVASQQEGHGAEGRLAVVGEVRLDQRHDLARALRVTPAEESELADCELASLAYQRWGEEFARRLSGSFALAIWDPGRGQLICSSDHAGFRPLYYADQQECFAFSTSPHLALSLADLPPRTDLDYWLAVDLEDFHFLLGRSGYEGLRKIPPGRTMVVGPGGQRRWIRHWSPEPRSSSTWTDLRDCAEALNGALSEATADAVRDEPSPGVHLSGGIDSAAVAAFAQRRLAETGSGIREAFSWSPPPKRPSEDDERARVEGLAEFLGLRVNYLEQTPEEFATGSVQSSISVFSCLSLERPVIEKARERGIGVLLSGWGGDEVASFNGRGYLAMLLQRGRLISAWKSALAQVNREHARHPIFSTARALLKTGVPPLVPDPIVDRLHLVDSRLQKRLRLAHIETLSTVEPRVESRLASAARQTRTRAGVRRNQIRLLESGHLAFRIEHWARAASDAGIEYRYPLLDKRVLELCLSFPADAWLADGRTRAVFRDAIAPVLPEGFAEESPKQEPARTAETIEASLNAPHHPPADPREQPMASASAALSRRITSVIQGHTAR